MQNSSMFSCEEFRSFDENLQAQILWFEGIFLMRRKTERASVELYSLFNFYVEVFHENDDEPLFLRPFTDIRFLDNYLESINIDSVYETIKGK